MSTIKGLTGLIVESYQKDGGANHIGGLHLPSRARVAALLTDLEELIFPGFACDGTLTEETLEIVTGARIARVLERLSAQVALDLVHEQRGVGTSVDDAVLGTDTVTADVLAEARAFTVQLLERVPALRAALNLDVQALLDGDPAVRSREEVILAYPGLRAVLVHRIAHEFWKNGLRLLSRMMSETIHGATGIDIHPGATIGRSFYIDHGTGVVIGETTVIGDHVKLYQGVSLGALSVSKRLQDQRRHPKIEDHVTIYAGATPNAAGTALSRPTPKRTGNIPVNSSQAMANRASGRSRTWIRVPSRPGSQRRTISGTAPRLPITRCVSFAVCFPVSTSPAKGCCSGSCHQASPSETCRRSPTAVDDSGTSKWDLQNGIIDPRRWLRGKHAINPPGWSCGSKQRAGR